MRPPFIWIANQKIDPMGFLAGFRHGPERDVGRNRWFLFRRRLALDAKPDAAQLKITVDGKFQLFVNETRVARGPARSNPLHQRYETVDLASRLRQGENVIAVLIHTYGVDTASYEMVRGMWRPTFGDGGLWIEGSAQVRGHRVPLETDLSWRCLQSDAWTQDVPRVNDGLGFIEVLDARKLPSGWTSAAFDDAPWDEVQILSASMGGPEDFFGGIATRPFPILRESTMPRPVEYDVKPARVVWAAGVEVKSALPVEKQLYEEPLLPLDDGAVENLDALIDGGAARVRTVAGRGVSILFDFGRIFAGYPALEIEAKGGEEIDIAAAEGLPAEWDGELDPQPRIVRRPVLGLDAHVARYIARPGAQRFERFEWTANRWLQVTIRNAPQGVTLRFVGARATHYPAEPRGRFVCSDPVLTKLWDVGRTTVLNCMHDAWIDCPSREQRQWLGDATVEYLAARAGFGPSVDALNAEFLRKCAESQRTDGLTQMFAPGDHGRDAILIPDWTLQWILNARAHLAHTGDTALIEEIFPAIEKALAWFEALLDRNGLVADMPYWHFMDWAGVGRSGEATALNAQLAGCFDAAADMAEALEAPRFARRHRAHALRICYALNRRAWDARRGVYVDIVDPASGAQNLRVSQHANAAMILWGRAPRERWSGMIERVTDAKRLKFTPAPPIRPKGETLVLETDVVLANTFYSHFVYSALAKAGRTDLALALMRDRFGPMLAKGATTLWESFSPEASLCHGFSASPTYQLSTSILGVEVVAPNRIVFSPGLYGLSSAEGCVAVPAGDIEVKLTGGINSMSAHLALPEGAVATCVAPIGWRNDGPAGEIRGSQLLTFTRDAAGR
jgi:alpha-L-rhamnosidase